MAASIEYQLNDVEMTAHVDEVNRELLYFQVSTHTQLPFLIKYDRKQAQWKCASGIYMVSQEIIEAVGRAIDKRILQKEMAL